MAITLDLHEFAAELLQEQEEKACLMAEAEAAEPKRKLPRQGKPEPEEVVEGDW